MADAADEVIALVLDRLTVLNAINQSTRECERPINVGPIQRWHDELHEKLVRFNLKGIRNPDNPLLEGSA
jgi:hypothetical protein